ncbi:MAG TPA: serine/threonine-protein kinase [Ktedonobacteraceae bacterium]
MQQEQLVLPRGVTIRGSNGERYVVEDLLGKGEIGAVYLVRDRRQPGNLFALKEIINPNKQDRERFIFEAQVLKRLRHSALPHVYRIFENNKLRRVYILMDYIAGRNLEELRKEQPNSRFSLPLVITLMSPVIKALTYLHMQDPPIIHRDIKPANVIIPVGADEAMLVDFGSAKEYMPGGTATVVSRRTPGYAAPEQYSGGTGPHTDIYGSGATLYTLLTGTLPVDALSRTALYWNESHDPLKLASILEPSVPLPVAQALQRAMSLRTADRFASVEEFWQEVTSHTIAQPVHIPRISSAGTLNGAHIKSLAPLNEQSPQDNELMTAIPAGSRPGVSLPIRRSIIALILVILLLALAFGAFRFFHIWMLTSLFRLT